MPTFRTWSMNLPYTSSPMWPTGATFMPSRAAATCRTHSDLFHLATVCPTAHSLYHYSCNATFSSGRRGD